MSKTVKIVLDERLRIAVDRAARRMNQSRSAFVRDALRADLGAFSACEPEGAAAFRLRNSAQTMEVALATGLLMSASLPSEEFSLSL